MKKYEFTGETKPFLGKTLHRIRRLSDGLIGGWISCEGNLDHDGNAWVSGNAQVSGNARVYGNAWVYGDARVSGNAWVYGDARVYGPLDFLHIAGCQWPITIRNDGYASIGCQTKTIDEWMAVTRESQSHLDETAFSELRTVLLPLFEFMKSRSSASQAK